ncbi:MAG: superoxide dismutase [Gammaproteobacteria bacterium]
MYTLPPLPYDPTALAPLLGAETLLTHHGKHHARYVQVVNELVRQKGVSAQPLEQLIVEAKQQRDGKLFNNAAQAWNHAFFWECMAAGSGAPSGELLKGINTDFGGLESLRQQFVSQGVAHFGSGWVWLIRKGGKLAVITTHDAELPSAGDAGTPILVCDVWEHAYYLDYKNERERFLNSWFNGLVNWIFVEKQYEAAMRGTPGYRYPASGV